MSTPTDLLTDTPAPHVARLTLHRPDARNALRTPLLEELAAALRSLAADDGVRCVVLTGGPKVFAAGADVREIADPAAAAALLERRRACWQVLREFPKPIVAAVNGYCLGGGNELALLCDVIVAGDDAQFGQPELKLGMIPGAGGTQRLTAAVGKARAMQLLLTGGLLPAGEALAAGLVSEVVPAAECGARALALAVQIAAMPPLAVRHAKQAVRHAAEDALAAGLAYEQRAFAELLQSEDRREGIAAFLAKRAPNFTGL
jgi:enoyl-CoA hydratase